MQALPNSWTLSNKSNGNNSTSSHTATTGSSNALLCTTRDYLSSEQDSALFPPSLPSSHYSPIRHINIKAGLPAAFNTPPHTSSDLHQRSYPSSPITDRANLTANVEVEVEGAEGMHSPLPRNSTSEGREWDRFKATSVSGLVKALPSNTPLLPQYSSIKLAPPGEPENYKHKYKYPDRRNY